MRRIRMSLVAPFETSFGVQTERDILLLKALTDAGEGWGECVAGEDPHYSPEYVDGAQHVLIHHMLPRLFDRDLVASNVATLLRPIHGHQMARAAIEMALIEQPLPEEQVLAHAKLAKVVQTPICLDESITSVQTAADAIELGACRIINIKPGRVGGYLEARRIHDLCAEHGVPVWMGGMLETGIGRAGNVAIAAMPNFTLPGDTSASDRYYRRDITEPFVLRDGRLPVPTGPGLGVSVDQEFLDSITSSVEIVEGASTLAGRR